MNITISTHKICGALVILLGLIVLSGWVFDIPGLIHISPAFAPMQLNTAIGLVLSGIGLMLLDRHAVFAAITGGLLVLLTSLMLLGYLFNLNIGLNAMGSIAPNSALCLALIGVIYILNAGNQNWVLKNHINAIISILVLMLSSAALLGYLFDISDTYAWGSFTQMALHSAAGFALIALGSFAFIWPKIRAITFRRRIYIPVLILIFGTLFFLMLWQSTLTHEENKLTAMIHAEALHTQTSLQSTLDRYHFALTKLALAPRHGNTNQTWHHMANSSMQTLPAFAVIAQIPNDHPLTFSTIEHTPQLTQPISRKILETCQTRQSSWPTFSVDHLYYICLSDQQGQPSTDSPTVLGAINIDRLANDAFSQSIQLGFGLSITHDTDLIYQHFNHSHLGQSHWQQSIAIKQHPHWRIHIWPNDHLVQQYLSWVSQIGLLFGFLITILLALLAILLQRSRDHTRHLTSEIATRQQIEKRLAQQAMELQLMHEATNFAREATSFDGALQKCIDLVCSVTHWPMGHVYKPSELNNALFVSTDIWHIDDAVKAREFKKITARTSFTRGVGLVGRIWQSAQPIWIENTQHDDNFPRGDACQSPYIASAVGFPVLSDDNVVAILEFFAYQPAKQDDALMQTFSILGVQIGRILEHKAINEALAKAQRQSSLLLKSVGEGIYGIDLKGEITFANPAAAKMLGWHETKLIGQALSCITQAPNDKTQHTAILPINETIEDGQTHHVDDAIFWRKDGAHFNVEYTSHPIYEGEMIKGVLIIFRDISKRKQREATIKYQANYDDLTGLPNRRHLIESLALKLDYAKQHQSSLALLYFDLDGFKKINDTYGHLVGDTVLRAQAKRLMASLRKNDIVGRLGGDEFAAILTDISSDADIQHIVEKLLQAINEPIKMDKHTIVMKTSIGIAIFPTDGTDTDALFHNADIAMYQAKESKTQKYCFYQGKD